MKIKKRLLSLALSGAMMLGLIPGMTMTALAADNSIDYTITIPATLSVANAGWNATEGITAQVKSGDTFDTSKKLSVTATSTNSWSLVSGSNSVGYNLATATGDYSSTATPASWEFSATELNASGGTKKDMGIIVEDYSTKPAGTYQDTVTFTVKVEDAAVVKTLTIKKGNSIADSDTTIEYYEGDTWADAVTRNPDKIAIDANTNPHRIVLPGKTGNDIDLCKDQADRYHYVLPTHKIEPDGNYLWW